MWPLIYQDDRTFLAKRFFDHPAISAKDYSDALYNSYHNGDQAKELFYWLLERADRQDLEAVKNDKDFLNDKSEFREAVNQALQTVSSKTRKEWDARKESQRLSRHSRNTSLTSSTNLPSSTLNDDTILANESLDTTNQIYH